MQNTAKITFCGGTGSVTGANFLFEIDNKPSGDHFLKGEIKFVNLAGPVAKVEVEAEGGELINLEVSNDRWRELSLKKGAAVYVRPKEMRVFTDDYSI